MEHVVRYLEEAREILAHLDPAKIEKMIAVLLDLRDRGGRLFFLGVGGGAANCSHAVNDFRKIAGIEAYAPTDNVAELTARANDEGFDTIFVEWLKTSRLSGNDGVFVFSVGGGDKEMGVSANIVNALVYAQAVGARILGVVGREGGYTALHADACVVVPPVNPKAVTPHTEAMQGVVWHCIVSDPRMKQVQTKWESVVGA